MKNPLSPALAARGLSGKMKTFSGCHQTEGPLPFVPMLVSRTERRFLAVLLAGVLLLCQTLAFANACPPITDKSGAAPCHDAGDPARAPSQDNCQHASPTSAFNVDLLAVTDLPPSSIVIVLPEAQRISILPEPPQLRFEPPPVRLVLCCLRN